MSDFEQELKTGLPFIQSRCRSNAFRFKIVYEDLLGDTLEKLWRYRHTFKTSGKSDFEKWSQRVLHTVCLDSLPKAKLVSLEELGPRAAVSSYENEQYFEVIWELIKARYPSTWPIIDLVYRGYTDAEIAEEYNINKATGRSRVRLIRSYIRKFRNI